VLRPLAVQIAVALLPVTATAAPAPKDQKAKYYAATRVGDKGEYRADGKVIHTTVVTQVEEAPGGGLLVTEGYVSGDEPPRPGRLLAVSRDAVAIAAGLGRPGKPVQKYDPPWVIVKPGAKDGDRWEFTSARGTLTVTYTARGVEKVEVPAGTFDAVRVEEVTQTKMGRTSRTLWHAPGVGEVKAVTHEGPGKGQVRVLHAFTPGKD
jgi:hypothetical protein